jgi:STE24 endopeptidase
VPLSPASGLLPPSHTASALSFLSQRFQPAPQELASGFVAREFERLLETRAGRVLHSCLELQLTLHRLIEVVVGQRGGARQTRDRIEAGTRPLDFCEHHYGLSNMSFGGWFTQQVTALIVLLVMAPPVIALIHSGIRKSPARWWVTASLATPFFILFFALIAPVFIAPLFNKYDPLTDPAVRDPILAMARANGVPADNVYQFDASRQHKRVSANVSGALGTIRISLNDNLLARCPPEGVMAVMGHELGHYVLNHVYERTVYLGLMFAGVFWFVHVFAGFVVGRRGVAWGLAGPADLAAIPVLFAGFSIAMFLTTPVRNSITRVSETEADLYGLNAAREPDAMADVFLMLSEYRKLKPGKLEEILFFSHPSGYNRILAAMRWKAEHMPAAAPAPAADSP